MGMNRHTDINKIVFKKQAWKAMIINGANCSQDISLSICIQKIISLRVHFCVIKQNVRIFSKFYENHRKVLHIFDEQYLSR